MSDPLVTSVNPGTTDAAAAARQQRLAKLRRTVNEVVGVTFFGQMLKMARDSTFKGSYGHGGRGEEIFAAQLDMELAQRAGGAMNNSLSDAIYERLARRV